VLGDGRGWFCWLFDDEKRKKREEKKIAGFVWWVTCAEGLFRLA
jgi:hypothetical protein